MDILFQTKVPLRLRVSVVNRVFTLWFTVCELHTVHIKLIIIHLKINKKLNKFLKIYSQFNIRGKSYIWLNNLYFSGNCPLKTPIIALSDDHPLNKKFSGWSLMKFQVRLVWTISVEWIQVHLVTKIKLKIGLSMTNFVQFAS